MPYQTVQAHPLVTNGFEVHLPEIVDVIVRPLPDPRDVKPERERLEGFWFVHWFDGKLFHLRLKSGGPNVDGDNRTLRVADHPWLLRANSMTQLARHFQNMSLSASARLHFSLKNPNSWDKPQEPRAFLTHC